jgi:hypothetical protein
MISPTARAAAVLITEEGVLSKDTLFRVEYLVQEAINAELRDALVRLPDLPTDYPRDNDGAAAYAEAISQWRFDLCERAGVQSEPPPNLERPELTVEERAAKQVLLDGLLEQFNAAGGRGVELADRIDRLRWELGE